MDLQINSKSHVPVHVQLKEQIKHLILTGRFEVGSRLPSIRAMAGFLRVNRNTVARVISDLEREGFVESRRGSGVYVVKPPWRMAVTTFFHVHEVQELMEPLGIETVALLAEATLESLQRLTELPEGTLVGVVGNSQTCMENLSRSIEGAGLDHLHLTETYVERVDEARALFSKVPVIVCSSFTARRLRELGAPEELEILEEDRTLDKGGIEMLGRMLRQLPQVGNKA